MSIILTFLILTMLFLFPMAAGQEESDGFFSQGARDQRQQRRASRPHGVGKDVKAFFAGDFSPLSEMLADDYAETYKNNKQITIQFHYIPMLNLRHF